MESVNLFYGGGGFGGINKPPHNLVPCKTIYVPIASTSTHTTQQINTPVKSGSAIPKRVYKKPRKSDSKAISTGKLRSILKKHLRSKSNPRRSSKKASKHKKTSKKQVKFANF